MSKWIIIDDWPIVSERFAQALIDQSKAWIIIDIEAMTGPVCTAPTFEELDRIYKKIIADALTVPAPLIHDATAAPRKRKGPPNRKEWWNK